MAEDKKSGKIAVVRVRGEVDVRKTIKDTLTITKELVLGKFNYRNHIDFIKLSHEHASKPMYLNKEVYKAFVKMYESAKKENINLTIISGTRNFKEQKAIWERKWDKYKELAPVNRAKRILEYSSMPTTSRHHWGTDIDLNNLNNHYFEKGKGLKEYQWLIDNANVFGFYQAYNCKRFGRTGYNEEKWHWTYLPLSQKYLSFYNKNIKYTDIVGFSGASLASQNKMIEHYVNGISSTLND